MSFPTYVQFKKKQIDDHEKIVFDGDYHEAVEPSGKKTITSTSEVDVAEYATAQVVDENLVAGNIKSGVTILGVTGTYEAVVNEVPNPA